MKKNTFQKIKRKLEYHYKAFDKSSISPDPLQFLHNYDDRNNIEIAGIISSVFAYGNVTQIIRTLEKIFGVMGKDPHEFILNYKYEKDKSMFDGMKHRFYTSNDIAMLFNGLHKIYTEFGSLNYLFVLYHFLDDDTIKNSVARFSSNLLEICKTTPEPTNGLKFMFPDPYKGSACKRMNLFLRWMVRKDELDFGLWPEISKDQLIIPVDTHIARISWELKLTKQKAVSWKMAEEITANLKKFDAVDPVKYDFAICHIGMRKLVF